MTYVSARAKLSPDLASGIQMKHGMTAKESLEFAYMLQRIEDDRVRYFLMMLTDALANSAIGTLDEEVSCAAPQPLARHA